MWVLKRKDKVPPGSFQYEQTEGIRKKFESSSDLDMLAGAVAEFRKGNSLPRATKEDCYTEIEVYNCQRLGYMGKFCMDTDAKTYSPPVTSPSRGCGSCGARLNR